MKDKVNSKITLINIIANLFLQIITLVSGFIIPKLILNYFGSEVNGLVSSINQLLSYISLIEGGLTSVVTASLYKPLVEHDSKKISSIYKTANSFYKKISVIIIFYTLIVAIIYPLVFKTPFTYLYVFVLIIILAINLYIQYAYSLTMKTLLTADKKIYIVSFTQGIILILNIIFAILSIKIYPSIHLLKVISGVLFIIQPIIYNFYIKHNYKLNKDESIDNSLIKNRWDGFALNIAAFIHNSTDIVILTIFTDFKIVSVYSVYSLVSNGLTYIISSISNAIQPSIGQIYAKSDEKELDEKFELHEIIIFIAVFLLFSIAILLVVPFVMIYTKNVTDVNYNQPIFGILLLLSQALYLIKFPHLGLAYSAGKFKEIKKPCYVEAILNIVISIFLVSRFGLIGVTIGTCVAMIYRMIFHVKFTKKVLIRNRLEFKFYKKIILFSIFSIIGILICRLFISPVKFSILNWIFHGIIYLIVMIFIYAILLVLFYKNNLKKIINYVKKK